jgi:hypothetical protein
VIVADSTGSRWTGGCGGERFTRRKSTVVLDPRKRQKKVERRKAKEKTRAIAERKHLQRIESKVIEAMQVAPVRHCCVTLDALEEGLGQVLLSRTLPDGRVAYAIFLLDVYCLGVKNAAFDVVPATFYESNTMGRLQDKFSLERLEPAKARKLVEGGVEYARALGFSPHSDYTRASLIFGDIDPSACEEEFEYGKDGKPFYIAGPRDSREKSMRIISTLTDLLGEDGFHFLMPA